MATANGEIRVTVNLDSSSIESELNNLCKSLDSLKTTIQNTFDDTADVYDYIGALSDLLSILDSVAEKVGLNIKVNPAFGTAIKENINQAGKFLTKVAELTRAMIANAAQWVANAVAATADAVAMWALNAVWTAYNVLCTISTAVTTAFGAAMEFLLGPVGLIIIAVVALIAIVWLLIENWDWVKEKAIEIWTVISDFFTALWATITEAVTVAWQAIADFIVGLWTGISETAIAVWTVIAAFFTQLWATITEGVTIAWQAIVDFIVGLWTGISETAAAIWTPISDFFTGLMEGIRSGFTSAWESIKEVWSVVARWFTDNIISPIQKAFDGFKTAVVGAWDGIWSGIKGVINSILGGIETFINGIIGGINKLIGNLNSVIALGSKVTEALGLGEIGSINPLGGIALPRLAQGAVIPPNRKFAAILGDQKHGINIETPLDTMIVAFKTALAEGSVSNNDRPIYITVESTLDGKTLARNQVRYLQKEYSRVGTSAVKVGA